MGGLGMLSVSIVLPIMGRVMDESMTGQETIRIMSILPAILIVLFGGLYFYMKKRNKAQASAE
jgi:hypothetical protein